VVAAAGAAASEVAAVAGVLAAEVAAAGEVAAVAGFLAAEVAAGVAAAEVATAARVARVAWTPGELAASAGAKFHEKRRCDGRRITSGLLR
jgi:hypothetical protein